jgi:hypothetical protein
MRFVPKQCRVCPFRPTSAPGWLGDYTPGEIFRAIWHGAPFFCHSSINYRNRDWEDKAMKSGKLCTGGLLFAKKILAPDHEIVHQPIRDARLKVLAIESEIECMGAREFGAHHDLSKLSKAGK